MTKRRTKRTTDELTEPTVPTVSVLVPCHNVESYHHWPQMVRSVLHDQPDTDLELVLVNNGSTDGTADILKALADEDERVKTYTYKRNYSQGRAWNKAAELATGRYFVKCVARAWFEPHALSVLAALLDDNPQVGFAYGKQRISGAQNFTTDPFRKFDPVYHKRKNETGLAYMYRAEAFREHGLRYDQCDVDTPDGVVGIPDRDFALQMIFKLEWKGIVSDRIILNYWFDRNGQMTHLLTKHQDAINAVWKERWPDVQRPGITRG